jgi:hypothetical protein
MKLGPFPSEAVIRPPETETEMTTNKRTRTGLASLALGGLLALGVATASPAAADAGVGGAQFSSTVECGGSFLTVTSNSNAESGSWALVWVWDGSNWVHDSTWHDAGSWSSSFVPDISFASGYYTVYVEYAQWTGSGYSLGGETITSYQYVLGGDPSSCYLE